MSISLDQVTKHYQGQPVVTDVSLEVAEGEFLVLLGPSGSGKSTLLRAIAGLTGIDHGRIYLHGRDVTQLSARERGVGLVFQNYALFRHMTVADNIEFALQVRGIKASERRARRKELLRLVALEGMDERLPSQLSGGQQQRVAVARALAHKPEVLLLDEPFGALDARIREELRRTIRAVQRELNITTVLVTHDQEEAFALADRIGVMNLGRLLEVGMPPDLYSRPGTRFVATFLGAANMMLARQTAAGIRLGEALIETAPTEPCEREVVAVLRPEEIELAPSRERLNSNPFAEGTVEEVVVTGGLERLRIRLAPQAQVLGAAAGSSTPLLEVTRTQPERRLFPVELNQGLALGIRHIHVLPTPLTSFLVCGRDAAAAEELSDHPLLRKLATRMKTRVQTAIETDIAGRMAGVGVVAAGSDVMRQAQLLLKAGISQVLVLPPTATRAKRVVIHWTADSARGATLAVAASLLRHLSAEAVYLAVFPEGTRVHRQAIGVRELLDARNEAHSRHGLEMRTELAIGDAARELRRALGESPDGMLIVGTEDLQRLTQRLGRLLHEQYHWPVLIVHRPAQSQVTNRLALSPQRGRGEGS